MAAPVALNTTKRKFHKLLDNLTANKSQTSLVSVRDDPDGSTGSLTTAPAEPPPKRSRLSDLSMERPPSAAGGRARPLSRDSLLPRNSPERPGSVRLVGPQAGEGPSTPRKTPNYAPYSHDQFLARLKTFADVRLWSTKPDRIGEVEWAKQGWICEGWNTVACKGGCEQRVVVILRPKRKDKDGKEIDNSEDMSMEVEDELVNRYSDIIVTGHTEHCLWRKAGCKRDIYHIPIARRDRCEQDLFRRFQSLIAIEAHLPPPESITYPGEPPETISTFLPASFFAIADVSETQAIPDGIASSSPPNTIALAFALFGWSGVRQEGLNLIVCDHCFQRVGLWLYTKERIQQISLKVDVEESHLRLNLLEAHREHCPWKNPESQHNPVDGQLANTPAWKTLQYILGASKRKSPTLGQSLTSQKSPVHHPQVDKTDKITDTWKRLKSRLKSTTSKRTSNIGS
ncbi:zf-C3HC-domain-containing protein [Glonium stellatum]|uniref:Zf-C3HC-domain-containing protein n=1 Tax=Glonium stellatum TaxID=574774 RepID=A0A8E2F028_9PEZI|nr:zf-C3HC-domain-containing protein [Glonium stellatum]